MTNTPRALAFYFRVSTERQEFPMQEHALKEFCRRQAPGWAAPAKGFIFKEKASGKAGKRTQLDLLCQACRDGRVDTILTYSISRLSRDVLHFSQLFAEWDRIKIRVVSVSDSVDTAEDSPASRLFRNMLASFAQMERETIVQRTRAGVASARKRGRNGGRPRVNDAKIARAWELKRQGKLNLRAIAAEVALSPGYVSKVFAGLRPSKPVAKAPPPKKQISP